MTNKDDDDDIKHVCRNNINTVSTSS